MKFGKIIITTPSFTSPLKTGKRKEVDESFQKNLAANTDVIKAFVRALAKAGSLELKADELSFLYSKVAKELTTQRADAINFDLAQLLTSTVITLEQVTFDMCLQKLTGLFAFLKENNNLIKDLEVYIPAALSQDDTKKLSKEIEAFFGDLPKGLLSIKFRLGSDDIYELEDSAVAAMLKASLRIDVTLDQINVSDAQKTKYATPSENSPINTKGQLTLRNNERRHSPNVAETLAITL